MFLIFSLRTFQKYYRKIKFYEVVNENTFFKKLLLVYTIALHFKVCNVSFLCTMRAHFAHFYVLSIAQLYTEKFLLILYFNV